MTVRVVPTDNPTHHIKLSDRAGTTVGLILANAKGDPAPSYSKSPVDRTALKTSSGNSGYSDLTYPYAPITQDNWSGGRGGLDFERDSTKFYDSFRMNTHRDNKAFLGPQEQYSIIPGGATALDYRAPGRYTVFNSFPDTSIHFTPTANYTMYKAWILIRKTTTAVPLMTIKFINVTDNLTLSSIQVPITDIEDFVSGWLALDFGAQALVSTKVYGISALIGDGWEIAFTLPTLATPITNTYGCFLAEGAPVDNSAIYYQYRQQQYMIINPTAGGAPTVWMNGDRGAADVSAAGKLTDATKTWTVNIWAGCVCQIIQGPGKGEYKTIVSNTATELTFADDFKTALTTLSEYIIVGSHIWRELTGHGLTAPVTGIANANYLMYYAQGDSVLMRSHREYNNAGTWVENDWRAEAAGSYAVHLAYQPQANLIWRGQNYDATNIVSISSAPPPAAYGTDLVFGAAIAVGNKYVMINGMQVYPNDSGAEALWVYKADIPWIVTGTTPVEISLSEMKVVRSEKNGTSLMVHGVYSFFTLGNGLERYYGGSVEDLGPNIGEGLPADRTGPIVALQGYPGRFLAVIDGGSTGYSTLMERSGSGWHEVYRARKGQRIRGMGFQTIPGSTIDRLWLYEGNIAIWLPYTSDAVSELTDANYMFTHEGALILSRMHAGMFDIQKLARTIRIWSDGLDGTGGQAITVDYRLNNNTTWTPLNTALITSPVSTMDTISIFGLAFKRIQLRIRLSTNDRTKTPQLLAVIIDAVLRIQVKYMYHLTFRVQDDEPTLALREQDDKSVTAASMSAQTKLAQLESWSDADSDSMLYMESQNPLYNGKYIFLNPPATQMINQAKDTTMQWASDIYLCTCTAQEA